MSRYFLQLPNELLARIICYLEDYGSALALSITCKKLYWLLDSRTEIGNSVWRTIRKKEGWPDPTSIGLSDYSFLRRYYSLCCSNSVKDFGKVYWEFGGLRLCSRCFDSLTITDYELKDKGIDPELYRHLPAVHALNTVKGRGLVKYRIYLQSQIPSTRVSFGKTEEIDEMKSSIQKLNSFIVQAELNEKRMRRTFKQ